MRINGFVFLTLQLLLLCIAKDALAQDRYYQLDSMLAVKAIEIPALNEKVSISVSDVPIEEFLRAVANSSGLNLDVQPGINVRVINNFADVQVRDMLVFLCRQFDLDLRVVGNIISIVKSTKDPALSLKSVKWDAISQLVSFDFSNVPVEAAVKEITQKTGTNVIMAPGVSGNAISAFIDSKPLENALEKLAYANSMKLTKTEDNFFVLEKVIPADMSSSEGSSSRRTRTTGETRRMANGEYALQIDVFKPDSLSIYAENAPVPVIIKELSEKTGIDYFLSPNIQDAVSLQISGVDIDGMLRHLFSGTRVSFRKTNGIYLIGEKEMFDFSEHKVIKLQNRSVEKLLEILPESITKNISLKEFPELNSLFVSGAAYQVQEFEEFIRDIDKVVPVVLIEVIILYINKSKTISTGIQAGLGEQPTGNGGTIFPGVDMTIGSEGINSILNEMGWVNLGHVTPNFYVSLQALESQGIVEIESTPKLSTLNGHEATLSIGNTEYYLEEQSNLYGTQNPQLTTSKTYKAINAELSVKIKPFVTGNEQITLEIEVHQSDFTERISETAPPGSVNRDFNSKISVKNQDMILLGGLMEKRKSDTGSGTPFLSRVPVIKWFFSSRKYDKSDSKLSILIRPTIIN